MDIEPRELAALNHALAAHWHLAEERTTPGGESWDALVRLLASRILALMQRNPQRLMAALYIHDLSERRYREAMDQPTMEDRAHALAVAVLEREGEKMRSRERYRRKERPTG